MNRQFYFKSEPFEFEQDEEEWEEEVDRNSADYVRWVQQALNQVMGLRLTVDGIAGPQTRSAVRSYQQKRGLTVDGIVGPQTEQALIADGAPPAPKFSYFPSPPPSYVPSLPYAPSPGSGKASAVACPPKSTPVDCPDPKVKPAEVLDNFVFDKPTIERARHSPQIMRIARQVADSHRSTQPIGKILIAGHTDPVGSDDYNFDLGWRRAREVMGELCRAIESISPGLSPRITFDLTSCGERQPKARPEESRRAEIFLPTARPGPQRPIPPDSGRCGVPTRGTQARSNREFDFESGQTAQSLTVRPRLCLFQNHKVTSDRNHFHCQASRWAARISAISNPAIPECGWRVGSTAFDTGADIIKAIEAAGACTGKIEIIHIFGHSGWNGVFGTIATDSLGLYYRDPGPDSRRKGGRSVADIPTGWLSDNVIFVLHGCFMAKDADNFAKSLFNHLSAAPESRACPRCRPRQNPTVYGHFNDGCAGRNDSWRAYTKRHPNGIRTSMPAILYQENGCCPPPARRLHPHRPDAEVRTFSTLP